MLTLMLYTQPVITQTSVPCYFIHTASSRMHFLSHSTKQVFSLDLLSLTFPVTVLFPFKAFSKLFLLYDAKISQMSVYSLYYSAASFQPYNTCNSPEKTKQQINSSSDIKHKTAVIPEDLSKYDFRKNAAQILVYTA